MTLSASERRMGALEFESGEPMIEGIDAILTPPHEFELQSIVIDVAGLAVRILRARVQPFASFNSCSKQAVTGEALVRIDTLARLVAFETVGAAFKLAMGRAEGARRDLPRGRSEKPGGDHQEDKEAAPRWPRVHPPHPTYPVRVATAMCTSMKTYITTAKGLCTTCQ
jgi:hypothetical protein